MKWLLVSIVLTVLLNVGLRMWPGAAQRGSARLTDWVDGRSSSESERRSGRVRVMAPWKSMLIASVVLTVVINVIIRVV